MKRRGSLLEGCRAGRVKGRSRGRTGFTLMEVMVSVSLTFLILSGVYGTTVLVFRMFRKESDRIVKRFDVRLYGDAVAKRLRTAVHVRPLRTDSGFHALFLNVEKKRGTAMVHFVRNGELYRYAERFTWDGEPQIEKGALRFNNRRRISVRMRKSLLRGYRKVTMEIRRKKNLCFLVIRDVADDKESGERWIPAGGDARLNSVEPVLFQDTVD